MKSRLGSPVFEATMTALVMSMSSIGSTAYGFFAWFEKSKEEKPKDGDKASLDLDWSTLRMLDPTSGKAPDALQAMNGKRVRVPGFIVPLEDSQTSVSEFLLVPNPQACIHVPPPPPNQIIHVRMAPGTRAQMNYGPVWVQGRMRITEVAHAYGKASFDMVGESSEPYD
jgi:hypothetical protein